MFSSLANWFRALSLREKILVSVAGTMLAILLGYYAIVTPVMNGVYTAREDHMQAVMRAGRIDAKLDQFARSQAEGSTQQATGPVEELVRPRLLEIGLTPDNFRVLNANSIQFTINEASPPVLYGWLAEMEGLGVAVRQLQVSPGVGSSVNATITLARR